MTDAPQAIALRALHDEFQRIRGRIPTSRWFFFGSITTTKRAVRDIDLLVVCETATECIAVRADLASICAQFPIHLLLMTRREEAELKFIHGESAVELTPDETFRR
jgi:hypothetical protein